VLICSTIIESGIDIPNANTILINDADRFGLAQLHQLRGRVGRYKHRAYAYMLLPMTRSITPLAAKRLKAIEEYSELGAGFRIALRDLEIRGAGNILGPEQSGHINTVGYELYCRLLSDAVKRLRTNRSISRSKPSSTWASRRTSPKATSPPTASAWRSTGASARFAFPRILTACEPSCATCLAPCPSRWSFCCS
jgi:transcription-repair coupling factor (superfamily II helicase)